MKTQFEQKQTKETKRAADEWTAIADPRALTVSHDIVGPHGIPIAEVVRGLNSEAHARLITAAPDLLEALTYTNLDTDHGGYFCNCPLADGTRPDKAHATSCLTARNAIAKAKGEKR